MNTLSTKVLASAILVDVNLDVWPPLISYSRILERCVTNLLRKWIAVRNSIEGIKSLPSQQGAASLTTTLTYRCIHLAIQVSVTCLASSTNPISNNICTVPRAALSSALNTQE